MFRRLLVANRGEVAVRVAKTARRLGVQPVAIYSEADAGAPWLDHFERAVAIGPAHPGKSYLDQDAILQAAEQSDCQALHPGCGLPRRERAVRRAVLKQLGIAWVGPPPRAIRLMGDKADGAADHDGAGLPTIPGSAGILADAEEARQLADADRLPRPAQGHGRRRRQGDARLRRRGRARAGLRRGRRSRREKAFGDAGLYLEKYILSGRHIEFQVLADASGSAVHLGERECSVQRRHQKLVEEAPSPGARRRRRARSWAARVARRAGRARLPRRRDAWSSCATATGPLYFMEMNTRLQVEHPVTEMVTGLDIVEEQIRIAANEPLSLDAGRASVSTATPSSAGSTPRTPTEGFRPDPGPVARFDAPPVAATAWCASTPTSRAGYRDPAVLRLA